MTRASRLVMCFLVSSPALRLLLPRRGRRWQPSREGARVRRRVRAGRARSGHGLRREVSLTDAPIQVPLNLDQEALAATMRTAWANFAANGDPSSAAVEWPSFNGAHIMSLAPQSEIVNDFASRHHCSFWASR
jgi:Carboxylesterase family